MAESDFVAKRIIFIFDGFREELHLQIAGTRAPAQSNHADLGLGADAPERPQTVVHAQSGADVNGHAQMRREALEKLNHLRGKFRRIPEKQHVDANRLRNTSDLKAIGR